MADKIQEASKGKIKVSISLGNPPRSLLIHSRPDGITPTFRIRRNNASTIDGGTGKYSQ